MNSNANVLLNETFSLQSMIDGISRWAKMESPSHDKNAVNAMMDDIEKWFHKMNFSVQRVSDKIGSKGYPVGDVLIAKSPWGHDVGDDKNNTVGGILVSGHVDTVHPIGELDKNPVRIDGDKLYGPGVCDMKGGVYIAMTALEYIAKQGGCSLPITFIVSPDEEIGTESCSDILAATAQQNKYTLVFERSREGGKIVTSRRGSASAVITVLGKSAHAGNSLSKGRNAIVEMATHVIPKITPLVHAEKERGLYTTSIGTITGGTASNVVPEKCSIVVDVRSDCLKKLTEIVQIIDAIEPSSADFTYDIKSNMKHPPWATNENHQNLYTIAKQEAQKIGVDLMGVHAGGASDGNFTAAAGCATLDGLGINGEGAHTSEEYALISSIIPRTALAVKIFETLK